MDTVRGGELLGDDLARIAEEREAPKGAEGVGSVGFGVGLA